MSCVYAIVNEASEKIYIGSTRNLFKRIPKHKYMLNKNRHDNAHLQASYNKYGKGVFKYYVVKECSIDNLVKVEQKYMDLFECCDRQVGYNIMPDAINRTHSKETIELIKRKRKLQPPTMLGKKHSKKTKRQISESKIGGTSWNKGKKMSKEHCQKLSDAHKGQVITEEMKKKISETLKGRPAHNKGTKDSEETKLKKSMAQKKRWAKKRSGNGGK